MKETFEMRVRFQNWAGVAALGVAMLVPIGREKRKL